MSKKTTTKAKSAPKAKASKARDKRIVVTLPTKLAQRLEKEMEPAERNRLIAGMLTEYLDDLDEQRELERRQIERKEAVGGFFRKLGDTFLP